MEHIVVKITKKGQATLPKELRRKFGFKDRAIIEDKDEGILLKPFPEIFTEKGSLKEIFKGETAKEILNGVRREEEKKEKLLGL
ncbi:MAG: AbrB/MazE/SpoVT family DNA-binding domain-containing protein [Euryarchaeota archaeon]|nr:AbrB/MazE/SpoVT family DNA-binding domain-containing protein [Euryarchaeota archaeon]